MFDGGGTPVLLAELDLAQRLGWTLSELDEQDTGRVLPALILQDKRDALLHVKQFLETQGKIKVNEDDLTVYEEVKRLIEDDDG